MELFRVLDWMLRLLEALERAFIQELMAFEEEAKMPYVTSIERIGRENGLQEGLEKGRKEGLAKGLQEGLDKGRQEGRQEGEALVLVRLITLKFGPLSEAVQQQIETAGAETLLGWSERVLTAQSVEEVLQ